MTTATAAAPLRRLVIVEDEAILALDIERTLTRAGFTVSGVAADGEAAVALVERERPDLVLMDIRLQGDQDGIETAATLKAKFDVPVVYLTAHGDPKTIERAQQTEPAGYLLKPFKKPDLQNVVTIALARMDDERKLRAREQFLATTLSCIGEAIVSTDEAGEITYLNRAAELLAGQTFSQSRHLPLSRVFALRTAEGEPLIEDALEAVRVRGRVALQGTLASPEGTRSVVGTAALVEDGTTRFGMVLALRDLTELLAARRQLEFSDRLSSLGTLAAGVAHEVNNPLSVVMANLAFLLGSKQLPVGEFSDVIRDAQDAAQRVALIVKDLQAFSGPQLGKLVPVDVRATLGPALHLTRSHWRTVAGIVLDLQPVPAVMASGPRLTQVLVALILNSIQAMKPLNGAHLLRLSTSTDEQGRALLAISDTGPGINAELRYRIFEPFFTTKQPGQGTGLGLAVARSIVENHGGHLTVGSGPGGVGACFTLVLPPSPASLEQQVDPLRAAWLGEACAESRALCPQTHLLAGDELALREATQTAEVLFLAMPFSEAAALCVAHPELEPRVLHISDQEPPAGVMVVRRPFDAQAVTALVRRK
jgi:signal transduction histidine kinase